MVKRIFNYLSPLLLGLALCGCLGSAILYDTEEGCTEFPNLGTVPEKPPAPNVALHQTTEAQLTNKQQEAMAQNQQLRDQFNLKTDPKCQQ